VPSWSVDTQGSNSGAGGIRELHLRSTGSERFRLDNPFLTRRSAAVASGSALGLQSVLTSCADGPPAPQNPARARALADQLPFTA
jgi:hypothetical protein